MHRLRPLLIPLLLAASAAVVSAAHAAKVPEFGCSVLEHNHYFGVVQEEDCAVDDLGTCFDEQVDPPVAVDTHNYPSNCRWATALSSNNVTLATCPAGTGVFSGGCSAGKPLATSSPWELDGTNVPDKNEALLALLQPNGWMCMPTGDPFTVALTTATALCCESNPDINAYRDTLQDCGWARTSDYGATGGVFAHCPSWTAPMTAGIHVHDLNAPTPPSLQLLAPAAFQFGGIDGFVDGEPLANNHPHIHGEPPEDGTPAALFAADLGPDKGIAKHPFAGSNTLTDLLSLCCAVPPPTRRTYKQKYPYGGGSAVSSRQASLGPDRLTACVYERALLDPSADPFNSPQHVAKLACRDGKHVVSGGCYVQFVHGVTSALLAGSYPYENGDINDTPDTDDPFSLSGENGWACRIDRAPPVFFSAPAKVLVETICCD